ncbi:hypothetical protein IH992_20125, partial [Candidatus Poribacteria bacterium]|nr:hypothetical protein [Candidatus Poribacteria bacterium]
MIKKMKLAYHAKAWRKAFLYALICGILSTSLAFAQTSDEEGLQQRRKRMPKYNLAQKIAWVPYTVIRAPLFILREGIKQSYFFSQKAPNPRELLTSEDGLVALYPAAGFGGQGGFTGELTFFHQRFLKQGNELRLKGAYSASSFQNHYIRY